MGTGLHILIVFEVGRGPVCLISPYVHIHDEQKANILVFIAHHIKNPQFIEATQLALTSALERQEPVTLKRDDKYYTLLNELCESLKKEIVAPEEKIDPEKERENMLRKMERRKC